MRLLQSVLLPLLLLVSVLPVHADDLVRSVQAQLKEQGFYYGAIDGVTGPETTAAIRRYQIRNGMEVTGTLTAETVRALQGGAPLSPPASDGAGDASDLRAPPADFTSRDQKFLERHSAPNQDTPQTSAPPSFPPPPAPMYGTETEFKVLFRDTIFEEAPIELQEDVLRDAQSVLARRHLYRGAIDGLPGPETARAILLFQDDEGLPRTGRLDTPTLDEMDLLVRRQPARHRFEIQIWPSQRIFRGRWVE